MTNEPLITILIPAYNHEKYIGDMMESILAQDYNNIEVLFFDDCSPDKTFEVAKEYEQRLKEKCARVVFHRNEPNLGICGNMNAILSEVTGELVKPSASDDFLMPHTFRDIARFFEENPDCDVMVSNAVMVADDGRFPADEVTGELFYKEPPVIDEDVAKKLYWGNFLCTPAMTWKKTAYDAVGRYDENLVVDDWDMMLRIVEAGLKLKYLDAPTIVYRRAAESMTNGQNPATRAKMLKGMLQTLDKHSTSYEESFSAEVIKHYSYAIIDEIATFRLREIWSMVVSLLEKNKIDSKEWKKKYRIASIKINIKKIFK